MRDDQTSADAAEACAAEACAAEACAADAVAGDDPPRCPACGYDLRGSPELRCPECGLRVGPAELRESAVPFAHRRRVGRFIAYVHTLWLVTIDSRRLRHEASRPQDPADGRWFRWVTGAALGAAMAGLSVAVVLAEGWKAVAYEPNDLVFANASWPWRGPIQDLLVPWSAGATLPWTMPLALWLLGQSMAGAPRWLVRRRGGMSPQRLERERTIASYAGAPLVLLAGAIGGLLVAFLLDETDLLCGVTLGISMVVIGLCAGSLAALVMLARAVRRNGPEGGRRPVTAGVLATIALAVAVGGAGAFVDPFMQHPDSLAAPVIGKTAGVLAVAFACLTLLRSAQWKARPMTGGALTALAGAVELGLRWCAAAFALLGLLPWAVGLLWIIVDSLR